MEADEELASVLLEDSTPEEEDEDEDEDDEREEVDPS